MYPKLKRKYLTKYVILTRNILLGRDEIIFHIQYLLSTQLTSFEDVVF